MLLCQDGVMLCKATAGMGVPLSVSPCIGATCPFIIFESADIDSAVDGVIETAFKKKREVMCANKCDVPFCQTTVSPTVLSFSLPSGPLGAVCAGEHCGQCCDPSQAPYGRDEVCGPAQWQRQSPGGCCYPRSSAAGGQSESEPLILVDFLVFWFFFLNIWNKTDYIASCSVSLLTLLAVVWRLKCFSYCYKRLHSDKSTVCTLLIVAVICTCCHFCITKVSVR